MDPLLDILASLRLTGGVFLDAEFTAPWCVAAKVGPEDCRPFLPQPHSIVAYHYVTAGRLVVGVEGQPPLEVKAGEIVILPRNDEHRLGSTLTVRAVSADRLIQPAVGAGLAHILHGGGGETTRILCGFLGGDRHCEPIMRMLPRLMKVSVAGAAAGAWIESSIRYAADRLSGIRAGMPAPSQSWRSCFL
jgi:hypothetical protein